MATYANLPILTPEEAAEIIPNGALVGFSAFTPAGAAKATPRAVAARAKELHAQGKEYKIRAIAGASTGSDIDDALGEANAMSWRTPYQSSKALRGRINTQECEFLDMHLSHVGQMLEFGFLGKVDVAVVEAVEVTSDGRIYLSTSVGCSPSILPHAEKVIVEINEHHAKRLVEMHDIAVLPKPPHRNPIPLMHPMGKIGVPYVKVDPSKIAGVVLTNQADGVGAANAPDEVSEAIAGHIVKFLVNEMKADRIPEEFLPLQAGVGNVANAVLGGLGQSEDIPNFYMYTEVLQDSQIDLMRKGRLLGASTSALTLSDPNMQSVYDDMDFFTPRIVLRPTELSNNPGVVRRMGVIGINTVLEMDVYGNANSTHVCGTKLMNGIGGSGDFVRNCYLSILVAPSIAKGGAISTVVPFCSHVDHNEHSVQVLVTDQGLADLRGLGPLERANKIIDHCANPMYRDYLRQYINDAPMGHLRHDLSRAFEMHQNLMAEGHMLPSIAAGV